MLVPKAPMNKDDFALAWEHKVRFPGKVFAMKPETVSHCMGQAADSDFRQCVLALDRAHVFTAAIRQELVSHNAAGASPVSSSMPIRCARQSSGGVEASIPVSAKPTGRRLSPFRYT